MKELEQSNSKSVNITPIDSWEQLELNPILRHNLKRVGYNSPLPIQKFSVNSTLNHEKDIIISARTGSGKTLAFGLPIINKILDEHGLSKHEFDSVEEYKSSLVNKDFISSVIIAPTRELVEQI
mmetsp:Transcript_38352/g.83591  ORF Transcript_38352/g.83591 Transcript_38352/m.83591 type:complete len:124 (-) Transcript_38352:77-448(-)